MSWYPIVVLFVFGSVIGSFLNVCIYRLPREESVVFPASHCPECGAAISWRDNIPLLGWLLLKGRCRNCGAGISIQYPIVELIAGLLPIAVVLKFGLSWESLALSILGFALLALTVIDLFHYLLPDAITKPGILIGLLLAGLPLTGLEGLGFPFPSPKDAVIGALVGYIGLRGFGWLFEKITGKVGMGLGDVKLLAMVGAWLGWQALPFTLFGGAILGSIVGIGWIVLLGRDRAKPIPFGPYLIIAAWIHLFYGREIFHWYLHNVVMAA